MDTPPGWILDRIEDGDQAVLISERGDVERIVPLSALPPGTREGDALREVRVEPPAGESADQPAEPTQEGIQYRLDPDATERLRAEAEALRASLRRGPSGPMSL